MATIQHVNPGDLIRADYINGIVDQVQNLATQVANLGVQAGNVQVPNLFGATLASARATLSAPLVGLSLGAVLDVQGNVINPNLLSSANLTVLVQVPAAGAFAYKGSSVNVVVSGGGGAPSQAQPPSITAFLKQDGSAPQPTTLVGGQVLINGTNFDTPPGNNQVTFGGVPATIQPSGSNAFNLLVTVPTGIPGVPTLVGQTAQITVRVTNTTTGLSGTQTTNIGPPSGGPPAPQVTPFATATIATVGQPLTINGQNFGASIQDVIVNFSKPAGLPTTAPPTLVNSTQLTVTVPSLGLNAGSPPIGVGVTVTVGGQTSNSVALTVQPAL